MRIVAKWALLALSRLNFQVYYYSHYTIPSSPATLMHDLNYCISIDLRDITTGRASMQRGTNVPSPRTHGRTYDATE